MSIKKSNFFYNYFIKYNQTGQVVANKKFVGFFIQRYFRCYIN